MTAARPLVSAPPITSPCVSLCRIDPTGALCIGCARTLAEIAAWSTATPEWRNQVMDALPARFSAYRERNPAPQS
ncbi:DUF1289 domain-containing protein [Sphingomonas sp. PsM26]|nr:DUF1289 domain-containing protein [Sphingomonas sp. PsM26]